MLYWNPLAVSDGLMGMAIVGGAALALGGLVGLGVAALKKKWPFRCASFPECNSVKCDGAFASWCLGDLGVLLFTFCCCWSRQLPRACLLPVSASFSTCLWLIPRVCLFLSFFFFFFPPQVCDLCWAAWFFFLGCRDWFWFTCQGFPFALFFIIFYIGFPLFYGCVIISLLVRKRSTPS